MIDCHIHTSLCGHAEGSLEEYVAAARGVGLATIAFTDHLPLPVGFPVGYAMTSEDLPAYVSGVADLSAAQRGTPEILLGIEADWLPGREAELATMLGSYPFDVVLGSVHFIGDWAFDDPEMTSRYEEWDVGDLWERYFGDLMLAASTRLFDVMAHPDLVKKFCYCPELEPVELYREVARSFAKAGVAIEVSTAGIRKPCSEVYPSDRFLLECRREGVPASVGSDAHRPEEVGYRLADAKAALLRAGYDSVVVFRGREPEERPL